MTRSPPANHGLARKAVLFVCRLAVFAVLAGSIGFVLNSIAAALDKNQQPAGFGRGVLQGVLMPMAMPNLLVGKDVVIYSTNNTGIPYKLGYSMGVNVCGLFFFGWFFWRLRKWSKQAARAAALPREINGGH